MFGPPRIAILTFGDSNRWMVWLLREAVMATVRIPGQNRKPLCHGTPAVTRAFPQKRIAGSFASSAAIAGAAQGPEFNRAVGLDKRKLVKNEFFGSPGSEQCEHLAQLLKPVHVGFDQKRVPRVEVREMSDVRLAHCRESVWG